MSFSSLNFIFIFLPVAVILHGVAKGKLRNAILLIGSFIFYRLAVGSHPEWAALLCVSALESFIFGIVIQKSSGAWKKLWLAISVILNAALLSLYKYSPAILSLLDLTQIPVSQGAESFLSSPLLPLGISFYTFKNIGYFHDVYSGKTPAERSPFRYAIYLFMFPQVTMGPIQSYSSLRESLSERKVSLSGISDGLTEFILGFGMKAIFADRLAAIWNGIEVIGYDAISTPLAWMGAASYSLQLYFDFAGYSLMALGLCKMLGFESPVNFDHPYAAPSMTEFWRRWHMTLGSWFRDHVYIPLGGNRRGAARTYLNLFAVWLLTGIWHGNTAMFILWGLFLFCVIALEKSGFLGPVIKSKVFSHIYMAPLIMISWMIFRLPTLSDLGVYLSRLFPFFGEVSEHVYSLDYLTYLKSLGPLLALGILFSTPLPRKFFESIREKRWLSVPLLLLIFWYSVYLAANGANNPFMYVNF